MNRNLILISSLLLLQFPTFAIKAVSPSSSIAQNSICKIEPEEEFYSTKELQTLAKKITVKVIGDNNLGSGTLIGKKGNNYLVLTNSHVIQGVNSIKLQTADGKNYSAKVLENNKFEKSDLAVLEFQSNQSYCLAGISTVTPDIETPVLAVGFSISTGKITFSEGKVKKTPKLKEGYEIGYTSNIEQGMSGGVILNSMGQLVGINGRSAYPILNTGYVSQNGKRPRESEIQEMRKLSWGIPISTVLARVDRDILTAYKLPLPKGGIVIPQPVLPEWLAQIEDKAKQFTVRIDSSSNSNGSGIIINQEGNSYTVLTSAHVLCERESVKEPCGEFNYEILAPDGKKYPVVKSSIKTREGVDLAVVKFKSSQKYQIATLANYFPNRDDYMFTAGYPKLNDSSSPWRFTIGRISDLLHISKFESKSNNNNQLQKSSSSFISKGYELVYTSITSGGMSGGPVLDSQGRVIGIHGASEIEEASDERVQLGYSLGIPISTFLGQEFNVKAKNVEENISSQELSEEKANSIQKAVLSANVPTGNTQASQWLERGNQFWRLGRYKEAVEAFDKAINQEPAFLHLAYYGKALALSGEKKGEEALKALKQVLDIKKDFVLALNNQSVIYRELDKLEEALVAIDKAIKLQPENPNLYNEKSLILEDLKRYKEAKEALNQAIKLYPSYLYYFNRGVIYYKQKEFDKALEDYNKAIEINPYFAPAYNNRALVYDEQKKYQLAFDDYKKAIDINPKNVNAYNNLGNLYQKQKKFDLALNDYKKAIDINPKYVNAYFNRGNLYYEQKKWDLAIDDYNKAIQINPKYVDAYYNRASLYYKQKKWDLALTDYNKAIEINPKYVDAYNNRGVLYYEQKKWDLAIDDYNKAIQINPKYVDAYYNRGNLYLTQKKSDLALADYNKAIQINPKYAHAYFNRATLYKEQKKLDLALADYNKAIQINPKNAKYYYKRGNLYQKQKKFDLALADYTKAIQINPKYAKAYLNRGNLYKEQKKFDLELKNYNKAIQINPNFFEAYFNRGAHYSAQKEWNLALKDFNNAIEINPNNAQVYLSRGLIYAIQKKWDLALADFNKLIAVNSKFPNIYTVRGISYQAKGNYSAAMSDYKKALLINPQDSSAIANIGSIKYEQGEIETAIKQWQKSLLINNKLAGVNLALAVALYRKGEQKRAYKFAETALKIDNKVADIKYLKENLWGEVLINDTQKLFSNPKFKTLLSQFPK